MAYLVQLLLPLNDNDGKPFEHDLFAATRFELTVRFGGVTTYMRAPARGLWQNDAGRIDRDDIVIFEAMIEELDREWWHSYRESLRKRFEQDELVVRFLPMETL